MRQVFVFMAAACLMSACSSYQHSNNGIVEETYIHKYGVAVPAEDWTSRGEHGKVVSTMSNGVVMSKAYSGGILDGEATYSFPHSEVVEKVETYDKGTLVKDMIYYSAETPKQETVYQTNGGKTISSWYDNGTPKSIEDYEAGDLLVYATYYDPNHQKDSGVENRLGIRNVRDQYGQLLSQDTIQDGMMTQRTIYHPNGLPKEITPYQKGIVEGQRKSYMPGGEPNAVEQWVGGKQHGVMTIYQDGEKYAEIPYENGAKNGIEKHFRYGTTVVEEISWVDNKRHGPSTTHIGNSSQTDWYFEGNPVTKGNFDVQNSRLVY